MPNSKEAAKVAIPPVKAVRTRAHGGVVASKHAATLGAATGGDGGVTTFHDNGGKVLTQCKVVLVFWGTAWGNAATSPSASDFGQAISGIISGPWATQLWQYRGIGPTSLEQTVVVSSSDPPASFTNADIQAFLKDQISKGTLPTPSSSVDRLYCVLMPTGKSSGDTSFVGQHQFFDRSGTRVYYAWVANDGTLTSVNSMPKVFSHELAEAVSDPDLGSGILVDTSTDTNEEIGDVCNNTVITINGAAEEAYWSNEDNRCVIPRLQPFPGVAANPVLIQSRFGTKGNFELCVGQSGAGLFHFWRNNDNPYMPWSAETPFARAIGQVDALTMIQSNFGSPGNLELVARVGDRLQFFWRDSGPGFQWRGPYAFAGSGMTGIPALIQSRFGNQGNFELAVPLATGGFAFYWRNNDDPGLPWDGPFPIAQSAGRIEALTMIQSNYGSPGNLELVGRVGNQLCSFWRDSGPAFQWNGPYGLGSPGVSGNPVLIQGRFGNQGNFELVTPLAGGGLAHYWRDNDDPRMPWNGPYPFGQTLGQVDSVSLIQSNYGTPGNLEVVARVGSQLYFFWRDSGPAFQWDGPFLLQSTVW